MLIKHKVSKQTVVKKQEVFLPVHCCSLYRTFGNTLYNHSTWGKTWNNEWVKEGYSFTAAINTELFIAVGTCSQIQQAMSMYHKLAPLQGWSAVHGGGGTERILDFLIQLVQFHQEQHHWVEAGVLTLSRDKSETKHITAALGWKNAGKLTICPAIHDPRLENMTQESINWLVSFQTPPLKHSQVSLSTQCCTWSWNFISCRWRGHCVSGEIKVKVSVLSR